MDKYSLLAPSGIATLAVTLGALVPVTAMAQPKTTVVELYTSEGCSSCPPAEALIGKLAKGRSDVIALAFHVDYWDYIGWRDRFELPEATQRQQQYQHALHLDSVYTPQLVIDGQRDTVGNNDPATVPFAKGEQSFPLDVAVEANQVQINVGAMPAAAHATQTPNDVLLVSYLSEGVSKVTRGENSGRELHEFNIVRSVKVLGSWNGDAKSFSVPVSSLPSDATGVAILVQARGEGPILEAATHTIR